MQSGSRRPAWWWAMQAFWATLLLWVVAILASPLTGAIPAFRLAADWVPAALIVFALLSWLLYRADAATRR